MFARQRQEELGNKRRSGKTKRRLKEKTTQEMDRKESREGITKSTRMPVIVPDFLMEGEISLRGLLREIE